MNFIFKKKYEITKGDFGPHMCLFSGWSDGIERIIKKKRILELELNYAKGWPRGSGLSFLKNLTHLKSFELLDYQVSDISLINKLSELRELNISSSCNNVIDCSNFPYLERIGLEWFPNAKSLFDCITLKRVFINSCNIKDLSVFGELQNLQYLSLKSPKIESIGDVSALKNLNHLELGNAKKLTSLDGIEGLESLTTLELNRCRNISNIEPVKYLSKLRKFRLVDCRRIESLKPVAELMNLEEIAFYESTNIVDGDLSSLKNLPNLKNVYFRDLRHYNYRMEDFNPGHDKKLKKALKLFSHT